MTIVVTGAAGFIGYHVAAALLDRGETVLGIDNFNDYYPVALKTARAARLEGRPGFRLIRGDIADQEQITALFASIGQELRGVVHLAAQAGVRYSLLDPYTYIQSNVMGQVVLLEATRKCAKPPHFVYASSSSVYGGNEKMPFSIDDRVDSPVSVYAATKKMDELLGHTYAHLYDFPITGLRFFTVYGPWGRPDMAAYLFADAIAAGRPIQVFNHGRMQRDFTYIDDIVGGVLAALDHPPPTGGRQTSHRVFNLGNNTPEDLVHFIHLIEAALGREAIMEMKPIQLGDVPATYADIEATRRELGFQPTTPIEVGIPRFIDWYKRYHGLKP
mgnify:CR=1 FL=1